MADKAIKETVINMYDVVTIIGNGKSKFLEKDKEYEAQRNIAEILVKKGVATVKA